MLGYDVNGNVSNSADFNGSTAAISYDLTRNPVAHRIEAVGKPEAPYRLVRGGVNNEVLP